MYYSIAVDLGFVVCEQNGDTALHLAIQHGHEKVVTMLLKDGNLNVGTCNKVSGTFYAYFLIALLYCGNQLHFYSRTAGPHCI